VADPGGIVAGEIRIYLDSVDPWNMPIGASASIKITDADGNSPQTCVLDDDGVSVDFGDTVGATGRFAAFGVVEGPLLVGVSYTNGAGEISNHLYRGLVPPDGVAPFYPIYVDSGL
jgi:hypothetical protein